MSKEIIEFDFRDATARAEFFSDMQDVADTQGTEAAKRFELVVLVGEILQKRREKSGRTLANEFNYALDKVASAEGLDIVEKADLTDAFIKYAALGSDLDDELKLKKMQREQGLKADAQDAEPTLNVEPRIPAKKTAAQAKRDKPRDVQYSDGAYDDDAAVPYSFSREAGPG